MFKLLHLIALVGLAGFSVHASEILRESLTTPMIVDYSVSNVIDQKPSRQLRGDVHFVVGGNLIDVEFFGETPKVLYDVMEIVKTKVASLIRTRVHVAVGVKRDVNKLCKLDKKSPKLTLTADTVLETIRIYVGPQKSDGKGGKYADSRPCMTYRENNYERPVFSKITYDLADINDDTDTETLVSIMLHETLHALGLGVLWSHYIENEASTADLQYTGKFGKLGYDKVLPNDDPRKGQNVPLETTYDKTKDSGHWRSSVFGDELMTLEIGNGKKPLSLLTARALQDLGYDVDLNSPVITSYTVPSDPSGK